MELIIILGFGAKCLIFYFIELAYTLYSYKAEKANQDIYGILVSMVSTYLGTVWV